MKTYRITEKAGPWVAGQRNPGAGTVLTLSAKAASHELRLGSLTEVDERPQAIPRARRKTAEAAAPVDTAPLDE